MKKSNPLNEALIFCGLVLGLSYLVFWGPLAVFQIPTISFVSKTQGPAWAILLFIVGGFVPSLAALLLTWIGEGKSGLRRLGRSVLQFKIGWRWYLAVIAVVAVVALGQIMLTRFLGHPFDLALFVAQLGSFPALLILGPLSEELGWRGYAQPRLQTKFNPVVSSLMVGIVWAMWHLPLFWMVGTSQHELRIPFAGFVCGITAVSVVMGWLYNHTGGSIWTAVFFHWIYTYAAQVISTGVTRDPLFNWLEYLPYVLVAVLIVVFWKQGFVKSWVQTRPTA